ncbi:hypothetical protein B0O99DRAFT_333479 [Bisporella sp. PMI_857]|nr:hypothetical protein B0O99DRAFT_333479 [Bisporella sp. PMI_857]
MEFGPPLLRRIRVFSWVCTCHLVALCYLHPVGAKHTRDEAENENPRVVCSSNSTQKPNSHVLNSAINIGSYNLISPPEKKVACRKKRAYPELL